MKIIYLSNSFIPSKTANSINTIKMCDAFKKNGNSVTLISIRPFLFDKKETKEIQKYYGVNNKFRIIRLPFLNIRGFGLFLSFISAIVAKFCNPDIVYTRCLYRSFFCSLLNLDVVLEMHKPIKKNKFSEKIFSRLKETEQLKRIIVISERLKNYLLKRYSICELKFLVAPDGADIPQSNTNYREGKKFSKRIKVGYIGHLYKGKGMEIISKIISQLPGIDFHIVGGMKEDVCYWREKLKNHKNIFFHGFVPPSETELFRDNFDILIAPYGKTVYGYKGKNDISNWMSPLKIFEYMSSGKPIIASNLPVIKEVLIHEKNALLCDPEDVNQWVKNIEKLLEYPNLRKELGEKARQDFYSLYTWEKRAQKVLGIQDKG